MRMTDDRDVDEAKKLKEKQGEKNSYMYGSAEGYLRDKPKFQRTRREYSYLPYYEAPDYDRRLIHKACLLIIALINDEIIKRSDLTLPWRPMYDLYIEVAYKRNSKNLEKSNIRSAILAIKELFPLSATKEILDEIRPFIDVWNDYAMNKFVNLFSIFVPLKMSNDEHDLWGAGLWYDEMWYFYNFIEMNGSWESRIQHIFSAVRYNKVAVGDGTGMGSESSGAEWIIWMLGGVNESAHQCFERLIKCIESFLHPLHEGGHTPTLQSFLNALVNEMVRRVRIERVPLKMRFTDEQIEWFVSILLPSVLYSVFSTTETSASSIMRNLAFLAPQLVLPKCLDLVYPSLSTITEPHRLKQSLECIAEICVPLVRDNGTYSYRTYNVCKQIWTTDINKITKLCPYFEIGPLTEDKRFLSHYPLIVYRSLLLPLLSTITNREYISTSLSIINESEIYSDKYRVPLREHAIFLLEALIEAENEDAGNHFSFNPNCGLLPALDMEKYVDLTEEEKRLCKLTGRFPNIVQNFVNKVFKVITQLSSSAPSDCISYMDSICDNSDVILTGSEEIEISKSIQSAFHALFSHCSSNFVELIGDQTYKFISTSQFENLIAADAACSLMQESTYANPGRYFPMYIKFLLEKQKQYITEEKKILKELDATTMWFTYLSQMIFSVPSDLLLKYQEECIQMHKCTISMICYNAYQLTEVYPISEEDRQHNLDLPLHLSLPIKNWGVKCLKDIVTIKWHIPTDAEMDFAEKLLDVFVYPEIQLLATPQNMNKFGIKRSLFIVDSLLPCIGNRLPIFDTEEIKLSDTAVDMNPSLPSFRARRKNTRINYNDPIQGRRAELYDAFEQRIFSYQKDLYIKNSIFTESHLKIMKDLVKLGTNFFTDVRIASQTTLRGLTTKFPNSKCLLVDDVLEHLDPKRDIIHEEMKGALYILNKCGFMSSNTISIRCKCWLAVAKLKVSEKPSIIALVQRSANSISVKQWNLGKNINSTKIRIVAQKMFVDNNFNEVLYAKRINNFRNELVEICKNKRQLYHWRQVDSARTFLFTFHRILFTTEVAEIFLQMLVDVRARWRRIAAECIASYLEWNKPLIKRILWNPPDKVLDPKFKYACGLRPDNLSIVYDSSRLPKMNKLGMKQYLYQSLTGVLINGQRKEDSDVFYASEYRLVKVPGNFDFNLQFNYLFRNFGISLTPQFKMLLELLYSSESERPAIRRARTKLAAMYCAGIIRGSRNWLFNHLKDMWGWLKPIIVYQIEGLMSGRVSGLTSETVYYWNIALKFCFDFTDVRRLHWLVETLFEISLRSAPTSWHRCIRLSLIQYISSCSAWKTTELLNRVMHIARKMIPQAWLAPERDQIANVFSFPAIYGFATGDESNIPMEYRIPKLGEIINIFDIHIQEMMKSRKIQMSKKNASDAVQSKQIIQSSLQLSANALCIRGRFNIQRQLFIKTLLRFLDTYFMSCLVALSSPIISLFPLITHLADEEITADETEVIRDADLAIAASDILFQSWSGIYLCDEFADEMLDSVEKTMNESTSWKAWVSIMKFLHVFIFSNIHVCEKQKRPEIVRRMVFNAICHTQLEVRQEAADCLTALIHCGYQSFTSCYIKELFESTNHEVPSKRHGAVLTLSAVIRAFPFTIPRLVFDMIPKYCQLGINSNSLIRNTVTETLRSFLRTHRDKMIEMDEKDVIQKLLVLIQNVISPNYYV
ncbi:Proteasome activator complex subunit 4 [Dirofilaria immitis]|nr:Proteasome activator complex subunit 4 [Dirofilaria immitis]